MKIGVCAKIVPDTDTRIKIKPDASGIDPTGVKFVVGPYDLLAVEEGVKTKEKAGGDVVTLTIGTDDQAAALRQSALAVGASKSVLVNDPAALASDALGVARVLAAAAKKEACEVLFCGKQAIDDDNVQVPAMVAELLGWPLVSRVTELKIEGGDFLATRSMDGGVKEVVSGKLPAVFTCDIGLNTPRYAKLPDIVKAKTKPVEILNLAALGLAAGDVARSVEVSAYGLPAARPAGRKLTGDADTMVRELVRLLREEAKVL